MSEQHTINLEQHTIELVVYVVGKNHHETLDLKEQMVNALHRDFGIRKLADLGTHVTLEYRKPEQDQEWTASSALSQVQHGQWDSARTTSALKFLLMGFE